MTYSFIDMDDDGIGDWSWDKSLGQYVAYDDDLDGDGIHNIEDAIILLR